MTPSLDELRFKAPMRGGGAPLAGLGVIMRIGRPSRAATYQAMVT